MIKNKIIKTIQECGGEVFIVGGAVRDEILNIPNKDIDFLIRNLNYHEIKNAINPLGCVLDQEIGGKISTLKAIIENEEFDIAIPRISEKSTGTGHGDFEIILDPNANIEKDLSRRDFTFNALAKDSNGKIIDMFGGLKDLENGLVRAVGNPEDRFEEDPLRMLRALQFAARFGFEIEKETANAIRNLKHLLKTISSERIFMEFEKAWTKGSSFIFSKLLEDLSVGQELFGEEFDPVPIEITGTSNEEKVIGHFISFFLFGESNHKMLRPTNEMIEHLEVAKKAYSAKPKIWKWAKRKHLPILIHVFKRLEANHVSNRLEKSNKLPMTSKELDISGHELMSLGLKGKEIGNAQHFLLDSIFSNKISNKKEELVEALAEWNRLD